MYFGSQATRALFPARMGRWDISRWRQPPDAHEGYQASRRAAGTRLMTAIRRPCRGDFFFVANRWFHHRLMSGSLPGRCETMAGMCLWTATEFLKTLWVLGASPTFISRPEV